MEFSFILAGRKAADSLKLGAFEELSVKAPISSRWWCGMLTPQYFVAVALSARGQLRQVPLPDAAGVVQAQSRS
jgi:hypothetical protein